MLSPYIFFNGRCAEAFKFYETLLGGKIEALMPYGDMARTPDLRDKIMHAAMKFGDSMLMGSDDGMGTYKTPQGFRCSLTMKTPAEAERVFAGLSQGGSVTMPMAETFFSPRFGMLTDKFAIPWMVNCEQQAS
ncbi:MAG: VOC family protein [Rhizomicrobium sp.]